jgi:hypothetical protein
VSLPAAKAQKSHSFQHQTGRTVRHGSILGSTSYWFVVFVGVLCQTKSVHCCSKIHGVQPRPSSRTYLRRYCLITKCAGLLHILHPCMFNAARLHGTTRGPARRAAAGPLVVAWRQSAFCAVWRFRCRAFKALYGCHASSAVVREMAYA